MSRKQFKRLYHGQADTVAGDRGTEAQTRTIRPVLHREPEPPSGFDAGSGLNLRLEAENFPTTRDDSCKHRVKIFILALNCNQHGMKKNLAVCRKLC